MEQKLASLRCQPSPPPAVVGAQQPRKMLAENATKELRRTSATKKSIGTVHVNQAPNGPIERKPPVGRKPFDCKSATKSPSSPIQLWI
jgi:hypothetical protein